jgi:hypothetical protein
MAVLIPMTWHWRRPGTAGVARVDRGVGLDEAGQLADRRVDLTVEAATMPAVTVCW